MPNTIFGNSGVGIVRGPHYVNLDFNVAKNFPLKEKVSAQLRGEFFNALNHPVLGAPVNSLAAPTAGHILSAGPPRILQFAVKLIY